MTTQSALDLIRNALLIAAQVTSPVLFTALAVGLIIGVLQTATQVNESSVTFLAKLIAVGLALVIAGPYILAQLVDYTHRTIGGIADVVR